MLLVRALYFPGSGELEERVVQIERAIERWLQLLSRPLPLAVYRKAGTAVLRRRLGLSYPSIVDNLHRSFCNPKSQFLNNKRSLKSIL
jgi:hypothetical protein